MSFVAINAITVPAGGGDELARRFGARLGHVDSMDGFEHFELLRPADQRDTWLVMTWWRDQEAFEAWVKSPAFGHGHARPEGASQPVAVSSELWQYTVEQATGGATS